MTTLYAPLFNRRAHHIWKKCTAQKGKMRATKEGLREPRRFVKDAIEDVVNLCCPPRVPPWKRGRGWCLELPKVFDRLGPVAVLEMLREQGGSIECVPTEIKGVKFGKVDFELRGICFANGGALPADCTADIAITSPSTKARKQHPYLEPNITGLMSIKDYRNVVVAQSGNHPLQTIINCLCPDAEAAFTGHVQDAVEAAGGAVIEMMLDQLMFDINLRDEIFEASASAAIEALSHMTDGEAFDRTARPHIYDMLPEWAHDERFAAAVAKGRGKRHRW